MSPLIVQRICHPLSICTLKGLRHGWSGAGLCLGVVDEEPAATVVSSSRSIFSAGRGSLRVLSTGASDGAGVVSRQQP